ncbi:hypothetical protein AMELA_G00236910 [Ameiurus melas]|uniref:Peptidase S1 domain-containing protein n=1 Tax=Ameiurus melas TaxID=219545 RepID=A0A7J5ZX14_AMEME|nr:hypothetical protein AMELA_G00236910 [Ameiurus melas]
MTSPEIPVLHPRTLHSRMKNSCKEEGEKSGLDMDTTKIKTENHRHTLRFSYDDENYAVFCNAPMTVQERLQTDFSFKAICEINQKGGKKELVIKREQMPRGAVTPNFPCCLLNDDELLDISFISSGGNSGSVTPPKLTVLSPEHLVSFYIKTRGDTNINMLMKNKEFQRAVDHVCVYAVKGETVEVALKRDGRFKGVIFMKGVLYEEEPKNLMNLSNLVDHLDGKQFQVKVSLYQTGRQESSQEMSQKFETVKHEKSEVPEPPQEKTPLKEQKTRKYPETKEIPYTQEILNLLRAQHGDLLKTLKEREKLKDNVDVKRFFREEYDKSAQSIWEVKRVKRLMKLSDSVCQIRMYGSGIGTGFLLFRRFVLTNAHVVGDLFPCTTKLKHNITAAFGFEDLNSVGEVIPVKEDVVAFFKGKDDMRNYLDFALLELNGDGELNSDGKCPELESYYSTPPIRGGVCIMDIQGAESS